MANNKKHDAMRTEVETWLQVNVPATVHSHERRKKIMNARKVLSDYVIPSTKVSHYVQARGDMVVFANSIGDMYMAFPDSFSSAWAKMVATIGRTEIETADELDLLYAERDRQYQIASAVLKGADPIMVRLSV